MTTNISPRDWEALSAYLDGQLTLKERQLLETRMQSRADLRAALDELRRTREVLGARLAVRAPRNFTLTHEMAGIRPRSRPAMVLFPAMRLTSVLAGLMFIFVVLGDLLGVGRLASQPMMAVEQEGEVAVEAAPEELALTATEAPALAMEAPAAEAVEAPPAAKAVEAATPTLGLALAQPIVVETVIVEGYPQERGMGGGEGETQLDQGALSQMAPAPTATPLPTATLTPTLTPQPSPSPVVTVQPVTPSLARFRLERYLAWANLRWIEIALAMVSVSAGLLALALYRAGRS